LNRIMGLDFGSKTIGVAVTDPLHITAQPVKTIRRSNLAKDIAELKELIAEYEIGEVVIGLPLNMSGSSGENSENVLLFKDRLEKDLTLPVFVWDERLSTQAMQRVLIDADVSRQKRKKVIDTLAAVFILQGYLDHKKMRMKNE
jgi:putative holliday junction resolvase